ncbi:lysylphosphatidylglycerol synthase transmembrane domain-containing protein [Streptomyces sp. WMMC500]|uniref:lysylphosphatidylglycerol synthase transmembrane domain-containing protein n=1 Tax=Streptomyces sp. WMMC500 TaxID=3015154 RepID=UPI00248CE7E2|nr:lysylphosphatidylglycerol synthase transmembrane domain-containing protein [Streptomyces sp. WMMC500]WBB61875.1 lysylphosphatidylglycerol synthase transmembrane domain-containing protein [Streptomyces sp. WMMC500]
MTVVTPRIAALKRLPLRQICCLLPLVLVGAWLVHHWSLIADGADRLRTADPGWLLAAVCVTGACWVAASFVRQGTILERLPPGRLLASQFAAGAANHLLPAGLGAHVVTLRFYRTCGIPLDRSTAALALYSLAEPVARGVLLLVLLTAFPNALRLNEVAPEGHGATTVLAVAGILAVVAAALLAVGPLRRFLGGFLRTALTDVRALHTRPGRALSLWGGALAFPVLQAGVLVAVALALEVPLPWIYIVIAYLASSMVAWIVPSPGGIGSVEATLTLALVAAGASISAATAAVLGFRIITVWLPLLPGTLVLALLVRRKVL